MGEKSKIEKPEIKEEEMGKEEKEISAAERKNQRKAGLGQSDLLKLPDIRKEDKEYGERIKGEMVKKRIEKDKKALEMDIGFFERMSPRIKNYLFLDYVGPGKKEDFDAVIAQYGSWEKFEDHRNKENWEEVKKLNPTANDLLCIRDHPLLSKYIRERAQEALEERRKELFPELRKKQQ